MEANQEKREQYVSAIKGIKQDMIVYIGESGIELTTCKDKGWGTRKISHYIVKRVVNITRGQIL